MKFVCDRCQTKYSIADEKVRGKVLKVRCKTCQNVITVREAGVRPSVGGLAPVRPTQRPSSPSLAPLVGASDENDERDRSERTVLTSAPAALMADLAQQRRPTPPPPPPVGDGIEWFLAIEGAQQGPFSRKGLVDKLALLVRDADVHVWNDRMDGWKPPADVPDVARELAAKRAPVVPTRPPVPRTTPSPPVPPLAARRGTMPLASGLGMGGAAKLPGPLAGAAVAHAHAVPAPHAPGGPPVVDPLAAHKTPPPAAKPTNGLAAHGAAAPLAKPFAGGESDALSALNLGGVAAKPVASAAAPRIMEVGEATAWSGQGRVVEGRHRSTKMIVALMLLVGVSVVMITLNFTKKSPVAVVTPPTKTALDSEALAKLSAQAAQDNAKDPAKAEPSEGARPGASGGAEPQRRGPHGRPIRGHAVAAHGGTSPGAFTGTSAAAAQTSTTSTSGGFPDHERRVGPAPVSSRPPPSQSDISRVIANNRLGIKTCYQRALLRDSNLTHGKIVVGVTIGLSGRVKHVTVDGPSSFRALEPCIKEMLARWVFPQSSEEYGTEFSYLFQGNE